MSEQDVLLIDKGPITTLTLNRPEKLNALNRELGTTLAQKLMEVGFDPAVRAIVIRGAGRAFCAGDDISGPSPGQEPYDRSDPLSATHFGGYWRLQHVIRLIPRPVILRAHGYTMGAGMDMLLAADYCIAAEDTTMAVLFIKRGIAAGTVLLPRYVGMKRATEMLFEGETIAAAQALEWGLVNKVVPEAALDTEVQQLAEKLASGPTRVIGLMKHGLNRAYFSSIQDELQDAVFAYQIASKSEDASEARVAWRERRPPDFAGR